MPCLLPCLLAAVPLPFEKRARAEPLHGRNGKVVWHQTGPARGDGNKPRGATLSAAVLKKQRGTRLARVCCSSVPVAPPADRAKLMVWRLGAPVRQSATPASAYDNTYAPFHNENDVMWSCCYS